MHNRLELMSLAEFTIMLKKNAVMPDLIHKEEATSIMKQVNAHITGDKMKGKSINSKHFPHLFLQVAMFVFGRDPINLSQKAPIQSLKAFLKLFEKSAFQRGESVKLFENPDHTILADNDMIQLLNKILKKNPDHPMPEGFKKIKIKEYKPIYDKVPDYMPIPEPKKIALEIVDEILSKAFGFHIFEPIHKPVFIYKAKPILKQLMKYPAIKQDVPFILERVQLPSRGRRKKNLDPIPSKPYRGGERSHDRILKNKVNQSNMRPSRNHKNNNQSIDPQLRFQKEMSTNRKRVYKEVTPEIGLNLRLEVVKYPLKARDHIQEVAETLEEVLEAVSKGITKLPPRKKYGLKNFMNKVKQMKKKKEDEKKMTEKKKNQKYEIHRVELQERLKHMKEEKTKLQEENKVRKKEMKAKKKNKVKKKKEIFQSDMDKRMSEFDVKRKEEFKEKRKKEEIKNKIQEELEKRKKVNRKEFLNKRKSQMSKEFKAISQQRKGNLTEEDKINNSKASKIERENKLKEYFDKQKEVKAHKQAVKEEYLQFYESPEIQKIIDGNFETISESFLKF